MKYVTITKLHNMLDGEANQTAVRKLMDRMTQEGYVEASSNRRLGLLPRFRPFSVKFCWLLCKCFLIDAMFINREACDSF